jgi:hypothetical protein
MTNQQHPITPPPELVGQWYETADNVSEDVIIGVANRAAQWGADQELEACVNYFHEYDPSWGENSELITGLRAARRPKAPSLRKQAYDALDTYIYGEPDPKDKERTYNTIRRALEQLND